MSEGARQFLHYMSLAEWLGLLGVLLGSIALWGGEAYILLGMILERLRKQPAPSRAKRRFRLVFHALCLLYALTFCYARFVEPEKLVLARLHIASPKIPAGVTLRIVHASDIHAQKERREQLQRAAEAIAALEPDLILLTGDYLCNYFNEAPVTLLDFLLRLPDVPALAVTGNYGGLYLPDPFLDATGIETLHTEYRTVNVKGITLEILGNSPTRRADKVRAREHPERFGIFLEHFPALMPAAARAGWDLYLAGHTHGGQVRIPGYGAIVTLDTAGKTYEMGAYRLGETIGNVSAGLGMECRGAPQVRLFCPPEFTLIEIEGTGPAAYSSK